MIKKKYCPCLEFGVSLVKKFKNGLKWRVRTILLEFKRKPQARQDGSIGDFPEEACGEEKEDAYTSIFV